MDIYKWLNIKQWINEYQRMNEWILLNDYLTSDEDDPGWASHSRSPPTVSSGHQPKSINQLIN